jgi:hypothetical protein
MGDDLVQAYRAANTALEEIPSYSDLRNSGRKQRLKATLGKRAERQAVAAFRNSEGAAGKTQDSTDASQGQVDQEAGDSESSNEALMEKEVIHSITADGSHEGPFLSYRRAPDALGLSNLAQQIVLPLCQRRGPPRGGGVGVLGGLFAKGGPPPRPVIISEMQAQDEHSSGVQQIEDSEIIALASVDYESASRLEFDRQQRSSIRSDSSVHPDRADQDFMAGLLPLLRKVSAHNPALV